MAFAVLAIWMLSLLAPLHQTAGLLRDLSKSGYDVSGGWSICSVLAAADPADDLTPALCPLQSLGKEDLHPPPALTSLAPVSFTLIRFVGVPTQPERFWARVLADTGQPRAPPVRI